MDKYLLSDLAKGKAQKRLSLKGKNFAYDVEQLKKMAHIAHCSSTKWE
jgi:hypothetical protein